MRSWILMWCGVSVSCLAPAVWAVDRTPANLGNDIDRVADGVQDPPAGPSGCWHIHKRKYKKDGVVVKLDPPNDHNHWVELIDKKGNMVAKRLIPPEHPRPVKFRFKNVDCDGAPHKVRVHGDRCDITKDVENRCRNK